jgi:hypothetical protein
MKHPSVRQILPQTLVATLILTFTCSKDAPGFSDPPTAAMCNNNGYQTNLTVSRTSEYNIKADFAVGNTGCGYYAELELKNPNGERSQSLASSPDGSYSAGSVALTVSLPMNYDDGTYHAAGKWRVEDESQQPWRYWPSAGELGQKPKDQVIAGFVQLTGTGWSPTSIQHGQQSTFTATLISSNHCTGNVGIIGSIAQIPSGWQYYWHGQAYPVGTYTDTQNLPQGGTL